jgi:hypothetical protein
MVPERMANAPALSVRTDVTEGVGIEQAAWDAVHLARRLNIAVRFSFNGIEMLAIPKWDADTLVRDYKDRLAFIKDE